SGDIVKVASGIYTGVVTRPRADVTTTGTVKQSVYITRSIAIHGGYTTTNWANANAGANLTVLDAQGLGRVFYVSGNISVTISGFRIQNGNGNGNSESSGGGIYIISATIGLDDNLITDSTASYSGGGVRLNHSQGVLTCNIIYSNTTGAYGAG